MFGRITQGEQRFFLNSQEIPGVQSVSASFQTNSVPALYLGNSAFRGIPDGIPNCNVSVNRFVFTQDYFIGLTGATGFNGAIVNHRTNASANNERNFSFISGYMNSYRLSLGIDGIPQTNTNFVVFNQIGLLNNKTNTDFFLMLDNIEQNQYSENLKIPAPWTVDISIDDEFSINRIQSLDLQISPQYTPLYGFGSRYPKKVEISYPIEVTLSFRAEIDSMQIESLQNFPQSTNTRNISLNIRSIESEDISRYGFNGVELISENYTAGIGQNTLLEGVYRTFLGRPI